MESSRPVDLRTIGGFLLGRRGAIVAVAADPRSTWIGLALVCAASLAREYDAEYLVAEPWHLLFGPLASVVAASILALLLLIVLAPPSRRGPPSLTLYRRFLGLFWMTAPLAFLYAIPFERFLSGADAMRANLALLGLVATWRVVLIIRVASVFFDVGVLRTVWPVMLMSAGLALAAVQFVDVKIFMIMGGIKYTPAEKILQSAAANLAVLSALTLPIWIVGSVLSMIRTWRARSPFPPRAVRESTAATGRGPYGPYALALAVLVGLIPFLSKTQSEQALRFEVESLMAAEDHDGAIALLRKHAREEFPPSFVPIIRFDEKLQKRYTAATRHWGSGEDR